MSKANQPAALRWRYLGFFCGTIMAAIGIGVLMAALVGSDPGRIEGEAIEADATILAQSTAPARSMGSPYAPAHYLAYYDTFEFNDRAGQPKTGHGEVSASFYAAHPVGAIVPAYYYPGQTDRAVLGTPMGLGPQGVPHQLEIGALLALFGGLLLAINAEPALAALRAARGALQQHRR